MGAFWVANKILSHFNKLVALWDTMNGDSFRPLFEKAKQGDQSALAKLLSQTESSGTAVLSLMPQLFEAEKPVYRIGITGPPGAGKSTLISGLIKKFRLQGMKVGVIAVDPSSPFTKGAILGDRIRYSEHFLDDGVFIRSLGTRGSLGGLSSSAYLMLRVFDQLPFDVVIIETVGVGQSELEIVNVADLVTVVLVPESGDSIQAMKAGLTEIADLFVVNKSDRPGADSLAMEIEASQDKPVLKTSASREEGIDELVEKIISSRPKDLKARRNNARGLQQEAIALLRGEWEQQMSEKVLSIQNAADFKKMFFS